jgi:hypothetical protein
MPSEQERLATLEANQEHTILAVRAMHADLKVHMRDERERMDKQDFKIDALEETTTKNAKDIGWMKKIGAAAWGLIATYVHFK